MKWALAAVSLATALLAGCATVTPPASIAQGDGSYLQVMAAGTPLLQVDGKDGATCKALASAALPFTATLREAETNLEIASHFRTEVACKKYASDMAAKGGTTITRNCTRS
jgi:uncharacterized protein YceK